MRLIKVAVAMVAASVVLTSCGMSTPPGSAGTSLTGPATAVLADRSIQAVTDSPHQVLPATVISHDLDGDRTVTVTDTSRIVALNISGSIAATIWALGFGPSIVGRDIAADFPQMQNVPVVTKDGHTINNEAVLKLDPTLVITDGSIGPIDVVNQLRDVGVTVVYVHDDPSFAGAEEMAHEVAAALGTPDTGDLLATQIHNQVAAARADVAKRAPQDPSKKLRMVFLYMRGNAGVYYLFGKGEGADDLIDALGGVDVAAELHWDSLVPLTDEAMVQADPDLILVMTDGLASVGGIDGLLSSHPAIALTNAGQHRRIVDMNDGDILSYGPRSASVLEALADAIYGPGGKS